MGLDGVDLLLEVEDTFAITISFVDVQEMITVGDLYEGILQRRREKDSGACLTQRAFYQLRGLMIETAHCARNAVRPSAELSSLLSWRVRRRLWRRLPKVSCRAPPLRLPFGVGPLLFRLWLMRIGWLIAWFIAFLGANDAIVLALVFWATGLLLAIVASRPLAVSFPQGIVTVGDLTQSLLPHATDSPTEEPWTDDDIWQTLTHIIVRLSGVRAKR